MSFNYDTLSKAALADISIRITKGTTPTTFGRSFTTSGVNYYKSQCIKNSKYLDESEITYIDFDTHEKLKRSQLSENDILFSMAGVYLGKTCLVNKENLPANTNQAVGIIRLKGDKAYYEYIYYYLNQVEIITHINNSTSQSAQPNINLKDIGKIEILLPLLNEQKAIAHVLSTLDGKIEVNKRINKTLENMAQELFKRWFVDFEFPNEDGELYKSSGGEMVESDLGLIPKRWKVSKAHETFKVGIGKTPPRKEKEHFTFDKSDIKWISIKDMGNSGVYIFDSSEYLTKESVGKYNVKVVPDNTVVLSFKLTVGRVAITCGEMATNEAIAHFTLEEKNILFPEYVYLYLKGFDFESLGNTSSIATAVNSKIIKDMSILTPDITIITNFEKVIKPIFNYLKNSLKEIENLIQIRDALLPKLMSGEIRVPME